MPEFMKPLEPKFKSGGFEFQQLKRTGDVAIFQKGTPTFDRQSSFEVVRIQKHKEREIAGVLIPEREAMPSNESWGKEGWSYPTLAAANERFYAMV